MRFFNKLLIVPLVVLALGAGVGIAATTGGSQPGSAPAADVKGNCDEGEHAGDPRCAGAQVAEDNQAGQAEPGDDNGGRHEAEPGDDRGGRGEAEPVDDDLSSPSDNAGPSHDGDDDHGDDDHGDDDGGHSGSGDGGNSGHGGGND